MVGASVPKSQRREIDQHDRAIAELSGRISQSLEQRQNAAQASMRDTDAVAQSVAQQTDAVVALRRAATALTTLAQDLGRAVGHLTQAR
jgi:hypothetical protein